jgi:hypothetical protein
MHAIVAGSPACGSERWFAAVIFRIKQSVDPKDPLPMAGPAVQSAAYHRRSSAFIICSYLRQIPSLSGLPPNQSN